MLGLENNKINFYVTSLQQKNDQLIISILHFLQYGALKILTGDYFMLRISKTTSGCLIHLSIFPITFPTAVFPIHLYRVVYN